MKTWTITTLLATLILSSCGGSGSGVPPTVGPTISSVSDDVKKLSFNNATAGADGYIDVEVGADDVSLLLNISTNDTSKGILLTEIRDTNGSVIYSATVDPTTGEPTTPVSEFVDAAYANVGDLAVFLPPTPEMSLEAGTYRLSFIREDDAALRRVEAFVKSVSAGESVDMQTYSADLNIWIAHPDAEFTSDAFKLRVQTDYKDSINRILGPHSLSIDEITFYDATAAEVAGFSTLDADEGLGDACQAMLSVTTNKMALNLVYVRELTSSDGNPAGVAPGIGVILDDAAQNGCFFVSQQAYVAEPSIGFTQDLADQMMAGNILHEAGHFMALEHPTEEQGTNFDPIADTPECDAATFDGRDDSLFGVPGVLDGIVSDFECGIEGGATNFIFYSGVPQFLPFDMSLGQAHVLRRHPLFARTQ